MMPDCLYWLRLDARATIPIGALSPEAFEALQVEANAEDLRSPACGVCARCSLVARQFLLAAEEPHRGDDPEVN